MADDEELYDDASSVQQNTRKSGINNLLSKFESKDKPPTLKPFINTKPNPVAKPAVVQKPKWGQSAPTTTGENKSAAKNEDGEKTSEVNRRNINSVSGSDNNITNKRMSNNNIKIPAAFQKSDESNMNPKLPLKPFKPRNDGNNNSNSPPKKEIRDVSKPEIKPLPNGTVASSGDSEVSSVSELRKKLFEIGGVGPAGTSPNKTSGPPTPKKLPVVKSPTENKPKSFTEEVQMRLKGPNKPGQIVSKRKSIKRQSVTRQNDGKKFYKVEISVLDNAGTPPDKPGKIEFEIDLEALMTDFHAAVRNVTISDAGAVKEEEEEIYDEGLSEDVLRRENVVSLIRPMSEGEESREFNLPLPPKDMLVPQADDWPEESYMDAESARGGAGQEVGGEELYEPLDDVVGDDSPPPLQPKPKSSPETPPPPPPSKDKPKDAKQLEKEKKQKKKEEEEKRKQQEREAERQRKQKEKETKAIMSQFKKDQLKEKDLQGPFAQGKIKQTAKASHKNDLAVQEGQTVEIIKMDLKEAGKWIVKSMETQKVGYVEASNVEVETGSIRGMMEVLATKTPKTSTSAPPEEVGGEEVYEDIGDELPPPEEEDGEGIYEFVPES